jgi:hypothetical protein
VFAYLLALGLGLAPSASPEVIRSVAAAVAEVTTDREEAVTLIVLDYSQRNFDQRRTAFGRADWVRPEATLRDMASRALHDIRAGRQLCGGRLEYALGYFHAGACRTTRSAEREARIIRHVLAVSY